MPASKRRKLRAARAIGNTNAPLGSTHPDAGGDVNAEKDEEERRLESLLFGVPYHAPTSSTSTKAIEVGAPGPSSGLEHVLDDDLFVMDDTMPEDDAQPISFDFGGVGPVNEHDADGPSTSQIIASQIIPRPQKKAAAWSDPSDAHVTVSLANDTRLRKLRDAPTEDRVNGQVYENKLRRQYEKINPVPEWATQARAKLHHQRPKRRRSSTSSNSGSDSDEADEQERLDDLLRSTNGVLSSAKSSSLPSGTLQIERLRDANQAGPSDGAISSVQFHPSPTVSIMLAAGADRRLRLFNVDGLTNPLLQTLHIPDLPLPNAQFHPTGSSILLTSTRPFFYTYDLQSGRAVKSGRALWQGTSSAASGGAAEDRSMEISKFSQDGSIIAIGGRRGHVHLVDWSAGGQVVGTLKMHAGVKDVCWVQGADRSELMTLSQDGEVYLWDVGSRRCLSRWKDNGAFGGNVMEGGRDGGYYAIGSSTGIVNVYGSDAASTGTSLRKPLKAITNLTTSINTVRFDPSVQMMAITSKAKKDQLRLVHLPSLTTFSNWPTSGTPLGTVTDVDFSAGSEYIAIGNTRGKVLLYNVRNFVAGF